MFSPGSSPSPQGKLSSLAEIFPGESEMAGRMRRLDWNQTSMGPPEGWPDALRHAVATMLGHEIPMAVLWGAELSMLYNDAYRSVAGEKHPGLLGQPAARWWPEIWPVLSPIFEDVMTAGRSHRLEDSPFRINRHGYLEETWFTLSYAPIFDSRGDVGGVSILHIETTGRVLFERRARLLYNLASFQTVGVASSDVFRSLVTTIAQSRHAIPFALLYRAESDGYARLAADCGLAADDPYREQQICMRSDGPSRWPLARVLQQHAPLVVHDLQIRAEPGSGAQEQPPDVAAMPLVRQAVVSPLRAVGRGEPFALLVLGVNPLIPFDSEYQRFYTLVAEQVALRLNAALALEDAQRRADADLRRSQAAFMSLAEHSPDVIVRFDRNLRCLYASPSLVGLLGGRPSDYIGKTVDEMSLRPDEKALWTDALTRVFATGREERGEIVAVGPLGQRYMDVLFAPELVERGRVETAVSRARDMTDRKHAEEEVERQRKVLEELTAQLRVTIAELERQNVVIGQAKAEADKANRAKSEFLSRMSHELRTPLNAVLGFAQLLLEGGYDPPEVIKFSNYIRQAGEHLLKLIDEVLDISRIESGRLKLAVEPVLVSGVLDEVLHLTSSMAGSAGVKLDTSRADACDEVCVMADVHRLQQIVLNLMSNAIKFNRPQGSVQIYCRCVGERCRIVVEDSGPGISDEMREKLFRPFERLDAATRNIEGTGLGLSLSRALAVAMNGSLDLTSEVGKGSVFWVELPLAPSGARPVNGCVAGADDDARSSPGGRRKALYIEDNLPSLELITQILKARPEFELLAAMQGRIGLELAREHRPDVILLDMNLPDLHGLEVMKLFQGDVRTRDIPVIIISSDALPSTSEKARQAGARAYLTKPFNVKHFLATLDEVLLA